MVHPNTLFLKVIDFDAGVTQESERFAGAPTVTFKSVPGCNLDLRLSHITLALSGVSVTCRIVARPIRCRRVNLRFHLWLHCFLYRAMSRRVGKVAIHVDPFDAQDGATLLPRPPTHMHTPTLATTLSHLHPVR